jgi:hypothetical protein
VSELLQVLTPKQRKASNMQAAYYVACSSGYLPVLQLLLGVAAAAPAQQLPVLLQAAADAGNLDVWRMLLQQQPADEAPQQQQQQQQQQQEQLQQLTVLHFDWSCLSLLRFYVILRDLLAAYELLGDVTSQQQQWQASAHACRLQMAELLWQLLVVQQGREAALREFLDAAVDPEDAEGAGVVGLSKAGQLWRGAQPYSLLWLLQHELLPAKQDPTCAVECLQLASVAATGAGDFAVAVRLHAAAKALPRKREWAAAIEGISHDILEQSINAHLRRACAAADAAAVRQLDRLACFAEHVFSTAEVSSICSSLNDSSSSSSGCCTRKLARVSMCTFTHRLAV